MKPTRHKIEMRLIYLLDDINQRFTRLGIIKKKKKTLLTDSI
jgi:hypothetical protein